MKLTLGSTKYPDPTVPAKRVKIDPRKLSELTGLNRFSNNVFFLSLARTIYFSSTYREYSIRSFISVFVIVNNAHKIT